MTTYQAFAKKLLTLLGEGEAVKIISGGYMPLTVETVSTSAEGHHLLAMSHTTIQYGDVMYDPEVVFLLRHTGELLAAEPVSFRNDFMGIRQDVYEYDDHGQPTHGHPRLKNELRSFVTMWFGNLKAQGFFDKNAKRARLR
ncbi:MAG: hypothetical protein GKS05_13095 [Nitrospirales bacterium]|nr:hypothetical protein [Nitrospirales bacterium]